MGAARLIVSTEVGAAGDGASSAAALAVSLAQGDDDRCVVLAEAGAPARRRPTLLSSAAARDAEDRLEDRDLGPAAARGRICWIGLDLDAAWPEHLRAIRAAVADGLVIAHLPPGAWRRAIDDPDLEVAGAMLRADPRDELPLIALAVRDLRDRGVAVRVATRPLGLVGARRAMAGLDPGGPATGRMARIARALTGARPGPQKRRRAEAGQALPLVLGAALATIFVALGLAALGGAVTATERDQRTADLAALSAARSMRDDLPRLTAPARLADGAVNPAHLDHDEYLARAAAAARDAARRNGLKPSRIDVEFPDAGSAVPVRARVELPPGDGPRSGPLWAEAEASPPAAAGAPPASASGGGYSGPLAYRQGKPMRPDVAAAFDRLAEAATRDRVALVVNSAFRSDAEQARLFAQNPDPRWVAPPGASLHRCGTELDLGPPAAYAWLAANAGRLGFAMRYGWEPWHFGFTRGPAPCSAAGNVGDGAAAPSGLPAFVPARYRDPIARAAARWDVSAALLAAQLQAESGFDPGAVSPAGAQGIAQFMPATAAAYGLRDPFDPVAAIDVQGRLMSELLARFGSVPLALAAYNAGPGAVAACDCVPPYPETQAYVARILALMGGAGEMVAPLEVRLVR